MQYLLEGKNLVYIEKRTQEIFRPDFKNVFSLKKVRKKFIY